MVFCVKCGLRPPEPGKQRCEPCLEYARQMVRRTVENKRRGIINKPGRPRKLREMLPEDTGL